MFCVDNLLCLQVMYNNSCTFVFLFSLLCAPLMSILVLVFASSPQLGLSNKKCLCNPAPSLPCPVFYAPFLWSKRSSILDQNLAHVNLTNLTSNAPSECPLKVLIRKVGLVPYFEYKGKLNDGFLLFELYTVCLPIF